MPKRITNKITKKKTMGKMTPTKRFKSKAEINAFIRKQLSTTQRTMKEIARLAGVDLPTVTRLNETHDARTIEETLRIRATAAARKRKKKMKKYGAFTPEEKWKLVLKDHMPAIKMIAGGFWRDSSALRKKYVYSFEDFLQEAVIHNVDRLDYYNSELSNPLTWIWTVTRRFCLTENASARRLGEKSMPYDKEGRPVGEILGRKTERKISKQDIGRELKKIPNETKFFLKKIGLGIRSTALIGLETVKDELVKLVNERRTGLTEREKQLALLRLEGKTLKNAGKQLRTNSGRKGISREMTRQIELEVAKKIKKQINRMG